MATKKNEIMIDEAEAIDEAIDEVTEDEAETATATKKKATKKKAAKKAVAPRKAAHMWKCYELPVHITFTEGVLGTLPNDRTLMEAFIASRSADAATREEEIAAVGVKEYVEKGTTVFARNVDGVPCFFNYQWKGYFKETCSFVKQISGTESELLTAFKKKIDGLVFIKDRFNPIQLPDGLDITLCQRPLRAQTAQGERISIACSEEIPAGSETDITVIVFDPKHIPLVQEWLEYGIFHGTGQWRNSSKGSFIAEFGDVVESEMSYTEYVARVKPALKESVAYAILQKQLETMEAQRAELEAATAKK